MQKERKSDRRRDERTAKGEDDERVRDRRMTERNWGKRGTREGPMERRRSRVERIPMRKEAICGSLFFILPLKLTY